MQGFDKPLRPDNTASNIHEWDAVYVSARESFNPNPRVSKVQALRRGLKDEYIRAYSPKTKAWGGVYQSRSGRRAMKMVWPIGATWDTLVLEDEQPPPDGDRILIVCLCMSGLTSNLQFYVTMHHELSGFDVTLGFHLKDARRYPNPSFGQEVRHETEWVFYSLKTVAETLLGTCPTTLKYEKMINTLFIMNMSRVT